jgi:hypothetical protein
MTNAMTPPTNRERAATVPAAPSAATLGVENPSSKPRVECRAKRTLVATSEFWDLIWLLLF